MLRQSKVMRKLFDLSVCGIACCLLGYFVWQAENGPRNVSFKSEILFKNQQKAEQLAEWQARRLALAKRVDLMRSHSIDPDLLDELARRELGLTQPGEIVVPLN